MIKLKNKLPKFSKKQRYDPFLLALIGFLLVGFLFVGATLYRRSVLETQALREALGREQSTLIMEFDEANCVEQLQNSISEGSLLILKIK